MRNLWFSRIRPATRLLSGLRNPVQGDVRIEIFNNLGSLVHTETVSRTDNDIELLTDKYPNGLYIIRISTGNELLGVTKLNINQ